MHFLSLLLATTVAAAPQIVRRPQQKRWDETQQKIDAVRGAMLGAVRSSWEHGTAQDALLELDHGWLSLFGDSPFVAEDYLPVSVLQMALSAVVKGLPNGQLALPAGDGSQLDGCRSGAGVLLGAGTDPNDTKVNWQNRTDLLINFMLNEANRTSLGALSHRSDKIQYWDDGIAMASSFLSAYGLVTQNQSVLEFAARNIEIYHQVLFKPSCGLFGHIRNDSATYPNETAYWVDDSCWATGNGWAIEGITRVKAAILRSPFAEQMRNQTDMLRDYAVEIITGMLNATVPAPGGKFVLNYADRPATNETNFGDSSSSALLAWAIYRLTSLDTDAFSQYVGDAEQLYGAVTSNLTPLGELANASDVLLWNTTGVVSTEAQAFYLMMESARRDLGWY